MPQPVLILFPLLTLLFHSSTASIAPNPYYLNCSRPHRCEGSDINVSFPFSLPGSPSYCGVPGYELHCSDGDSKLSIKLAEGDYIVKEINYTQGILSLVDSDFLGNSCPRTFTNTSINSTLFDFADFDSKVTVYVNCSSFLPGFVEIPCFNDQTFGQHSYYKLQTGPWSFMTAFFEGCQLTAAVPVNKMAAMSLNNSSANFGEALQQGFELKWSAGKDWCNGCIDAGGVCGYDSTRATDFVCFCPNNNSLGSCSYGHSKTGTFSREKKFIIGLITGFVFILACTLLYFGIRWKKGQALFICRKETNKIAQTIEAFLETNGSLHPKRYKYSDLKKITNSFAEKLGEGGYGAVYKGSLNDGHLVAVKILNDTKGNGEDFVNEVASIGRTSHVNVVSLLGFCLEGSRRALIYDFMYNGSLEKYIYSSDLKSTLGLEMLYQIAIDIARGLEYLHRGCNTRIVHFDIKPHNILLDQDFCPKISDFGLAKLCPKKDSIISMEDARGTIGFIAPEVFSRNFGVVSSKSDVYSYGMMLLEMVGGRRNVKAVVEHSSEIYFPHWIYEHFHEIQNLEALELTDETEEMAKKMILVGLWCIQPMPGDRPSMSRVMDMLEGSCDDLQLPPKPFSSSP